MPLRSCHRCQQDWRRSAVECRAETPLLGAAEHQRTKLGVLQPDGWHAGQAQRLAEQPCCQLGQEGRERRRLGETAAGAVDDVHAIARGGEQSGHAATIRIQLQRIDHAAGNPAQQHADRLQATQRLQEEAAIAHGEVAALDQRAGQLARQQYVPVPGGVGVPRRQQRRRAGRRDPSQHVQAKLDERIEVARGLRDEQFRHDAAEPPAVLQGVRETIGETGVVRQDIPCAIRGTHEVGRIELQLRAEIVVRGMTTWPQERRIGVHQRWRHNAISQQALGAVQIGEHRIQQAGALGQPDFERLEFRLGQRQRDRVEPPRIGWRARKQARGALLLHHSVEPPAALGEHTVAQAGQHAEQTAPLRAQPSLAVHHLVASHCGKLTSQLDRRKSSVRGCSRDTASFGFAIGPGVWPNGRNRARRRASASLALTGKCS